MIRRLRALILILLLSALAGAVCAPAAASRCEEFMSLFSGPFHDPGPMGKWILESPLIEAERVWDTYTDIVLRGLDPDRDKADELFDHLGRTEGTKLIRKTYSMISFFEPEYVDAMKAAEEVIPPKGKIGDFGCGKGVGCTYLKFAQPNRDLLLIEQIDLYIALALERMQIVSNHLGSSSKVDSINADATKIELQENSLDGALASLFLQHLSYHQRRGMFWRIAHTLKPGGVFVVIEYLPEFWYSGGANDDIRHRIRNAVINGCPMRRGHLSLFGAEQRGSFSPIDTPCPLDPLSTSPAELIASARNAKLELVGEPTLLRGSLVRLVFKKKS